MFKAISGRISETVTFIRHVRLDGNHGSWMTLKAVTRYCGYTVRDKLLFITNRKSHVGFQMT